MFCGLYAKDGGECRYGKVKILQYKNSGNSELIFQVTMLKKPSVKIPLAPDPEMQNEKTAKIISTTVTKSSALVHEAK